MNSCCGRIEAACPLVPDSSGGLYKVRKEDECAHRQGDHFRKMLPPPLVHQQAMMSGPVVVPMLSAVQILLRLGRRPR